jgi:hypothetical protein
MLIGMMTAIRHMLSLYQMALWGALIWVSQPAEGVAVAGNRVQRLFR